MKSSILAALGFTGAALAHGIVSEICIDGKFYDLYDPSNTPYVQPKPDVVGWTVPGPNPVMDVESAAIACNDGSQSATMYAHADAGAEVTLFWTKWPASHQGPIMTYLAGVSTEDPTKLDFFKINHSGLNSDGTWATDTLIKNNNSYTVHIPKDLLAGHYVLRHEILALQDANVTSGAQFYPVCINLEISGFGAAVPTDTVQFPGGYKPKDSDILIDIYHPHPITHYNIPGPAPYEEGQISPSPGLPTPTPSQIRYVPKLKPEAEYPRSSPSSYPIYPMYYNSSLTYPEPMTTITSKVTKTRWVYPTKEPVYSDVSDVVPTSKNTTPPIYPDVAPTSKNTSTTPLPIVYTTKTVHKTVTVTAPSKPTKTKTVTKTKIVSVTATETPTCTRAGRYNSNFYGKRDGLQS